MEQAKRQAPKMKNLLDASNSFYQDLLGYKPEQTSLQRIPENQRDNFTRIRGLNPNSSGIYLPRNQKAIIRNENPLSLFHEYFGHGLYCEQSLDGRKLVALEKRLLEEERQEFSSIRFSLEDLQRFRQQNQTFQELENFRQENLGRYELFAIWTEYLLSGKFDLKDDFDIKYDFLSRREKEAIDLVINFSQTYGDLATFYEQGIARKTTPKRLKRLLEDIYGDEAVNKSRLILLTGSKKIFSDIDLFASSNYLQITKNNWLDLVVFDEKDFEKRIELFETQITHSIMVGELIIGDKEYLQQKRKQLQEQQITEKAIQHNLRLSKEQKELAFNYPDNSEERNRGLNYSKTYFANALALKKGLRLFTKEDLLSYPHSENFIDLKGGIKKKENVRTNSL